jgi:hypothetical protein
MLQKISALLEDYHLLGCDAMQYGKKFSNTGVLD